MAWLYFTVKISLKVYKVVLDAPAAFFFEFIYSTTNYGVYILFVQESGSKLSDFPLLLEEVLQAYLFSLQKYSYCIL